MLREAKSCFKLEHDPEVLMRGLIKAKAAYFEKQDIRANKGIKELLKYLRSNGYRTALASSSPLELIRLILDKLDITDHFEVILSGEEVKKGKPEPDIYLEAARRLKSKPSGCIVLEDSQYGVNSAKSAGMTCIGYTAPGYASCGLSGTDHIVFDIGEVKGILTSLNKMAGKSSG